jgi:hypothetical protein
MHHAGYIALYAWRRRTEGSPNAQNRSPSGKQGKTNLDLLNHTVCTSPGRSHPTEPVVCLPFPTGGTNNPMGPCDDHHGAVKLPPRRSVPCAVGWGVWHTSKPSPAQVGGGGKASVEGDTTRHK